MGKPKKGKKGKDDDFGDDDDIDSLADTNTEEMDAKLPNKATKKGKKSKKGHKDDELDDAEREITTMAVAANGEDEQTEESQPAPKKKEKKKKKKGGDEDEEDETSTSQGGSALSRFQMLALSDGEDDAGDKGSDDDEDQEKASNGIVLESVGTQESQSKSKKEKKKSKKTKTKTAEEEDVDAILAALEEPTEKKKGKKKKKDANAPAEDMAEEETKAEDQATEVEKQAPRVVTIDDYDSEEDTKKKKKKKNKKEKEEKEGEGVEGEGVEGEGEEEGTVKTAAQKKKEKKERERLKKLQKQKKEGVGEATGEGEQVQASREATPAEPDAGEDGEAAGEEEGEKESKKKKKKKGEKEKEEKKPKNALVAKIKEQQARIREEEEARRRAEEEAERLEEERVRRLEEEKRLEEERRLKKKQKKKEREERLKKEGKFLTEKQKQERMRLHQMLNNIKEQGGVVPNKDEVPKKRPFYGKKKPKDQQKGEESEKSPSPEDERAPELKMEETAAPETKEQAADDAVKAEEEEEAEDVKDAWDAESEEEEEEEDKTKAAVETQVSVRSRESRESDEQSDKDEDESSEEESSEESESDDDRPPAERGKDKVLKRRAAAEEHITTDVLRAPVVCVLGHVDTGKTKILDKLRRTNVQDGEAGGITQQIGATNVPKEAIIEKTKMVKDFNKDKLKVPGLLIIDTPGHESFSNLRSRGSSLCDIAILVVDIMHGLEPQTIESINLLKARKTPFVVALNKVDRLYGWRSFPQNDIINVIKSQTAHTKSEFDERATLVMTQLAEEGLNAKLFYENKNPKEYVSLVPTSAHSGDGMGNLVALICELTQSLLAKRIAYSEELQATVMEVKALHGMGTTIDVILVNGTIYEGQTIVLAGTEGPIITTIRGLLMPQPMKELRVKTNTYQHQKSVQAAQGVKLIAKDLEKALAGLPLYAVHNHDKDEIEYFKTEAQRGLDDALQSIKLSDRGVFVQASTLGSLEALLEYLRSTKVKYAGINIGPVHKKDIMKASIMLEHDPQYAVILAFDVEVKRDVQELADSLGVTIFTADIIYHLFDKFTQYRDELLKKKQEEFKHVAVFPCKLKIMPQYIFNSRDPIVMGVVVQNGFLKEGTPICVPSKDFVDIGRVAGIEFNHKPVEIARQGQEVCIKILPLPGEAPKMFGRHFDADDLLVSKISRESIDAVKDYFRKEMTKPDWMLIMELKKLFQIL